MKRCSTTLGTREKRIKAITSCHLMLVRMAIIPKQEITNASVNVEKRELLYTVAGLQISMITMENNTEDL